MPYKDPKKDRDYANEEKLFLARGGRAKQSERQRARRALDAAGVDRDGKHIDHVQKIKDGGTSTPGNIRLRSAAANVRDNAHRKPGTASAAAKRATKK